MEAIILAGGLGTRLRSVVPDLPKCMAPVNGKPFLTYVIKYLQQQGVKRFIFSLGYMNETIVEFIRKNFPDLNFNLSIEEEPLGTGGAIQKAMTFAESDNVIATNGDTMFKVDVKSVVDFHIRKQAECTLSLKPMIDFERYGVVEIDNEGTIVDFKEKRYYAKGLINGGLYVISKTYFLQKKLPEKFSFEKDYLESFYTEHKMAGISQDAYFIDIGIPHDFQKAQNEFLVE